jgi:hypothetical protein
LKQYTALFLNVSTVSSYIYENSPSADSGIKHIAGKAVTQYEESLSIIAKRRGAAKVMTVAARTSQYVDILWIKDPTPRLMRTPVTTSGMYLTEVCPAERFWTSWNLPCISHESQVYLLTDGTR